MKKIFNLTDEDVVKMIMGVFAAGHNIQDAAQVCGGLFEESESEYDKEFVKHFNRMHCYTLAVRSICKNNNLKTASELYNEWQHQTTDKKFVKGIFELYFMDISLEIVDFPHPEAPTKATRSPGRRVILKSSISGLASLE